MRSVARWLCRIAALIAVVSAIVALALGHSTRASSVNPLSAEFPTASGQKIERTVAIREPGRYFLRAEFDARGTLEPVFQAFGTSKQRSLPSDLIVELKGTGGPAIRQEIDKLTATTSSGGADGRLGFTLLYADLATGNLAVTVENRGGLADLASSNPKLELVLNSAAIEGRLRLEQIAILTFAIAAIVAGVLFGLGRSSSSAVR